MDLVQFVNKHGETIERGDVLVIGENQTPSYYGSQQEFVPEVDLTEEAHDTRVCGIVYQLHAELKMEEATEDEAAAAPKGRTKRGGKSASSRSKAAEVPQQAFTLEEFESLDNTRVGPGQTGFMVILGMCAECKVDADIAPVKAGDLLTTSPTKGHAQKALNPQEATGAIVGKALGPLKKGRGKIPVLVMIQ